jgi:hypothetical protein
MKFPSIKAAMMAVPMLIAAPLGATASPFTLLEFDNLSFAEEYVYFRLVREAGPNFFGVSDFPPFPDDAVAFLQLPILVRPGKDYFVSEDKVEENGQLVSREGGELFFETAARTFGFGMVTFEFSTDTQGNVVSLSSSDGEGSSDFFRWEKSDSVSEFEWIYEYFDSTCVGGGGPFDCIRITGGGGNMNGTWSVVATSPIPLPASSLLLLSGLAVAASMSGHARRRTR